LLLRVGRFAHFLDDPFSEHFCWRLPSQAFAWGVVQPITDHLHAVDRPTIERPVRCAIEIVGARPSNPTLSTKSSSATPSAHSKQRYVRVAAYRSTADAQAMAATLWRKGVPAIVGGVTRNGKTHPARLVEPFATATAAAAQAGFRQVRQAGYRDARLAR